MIRPKVKELVDLGRLPAEAKADPATVARHERLILALEVPVSDAEACALVDVFGQDDCFGLAASLVARIETAPHWPILECLRDRANPWVLELCKRAGYEEHPQVTVR